ncbi:head-to-tail connector [Mycobacterium phage Makemake]|uniref:Head-to-tail connector protein n=1 Tax=Mycobacterium phage KSSJEB TaxID=2922216 RepID=G1D6W0_9CAUD|nr:head-tail connector protein [Mycobacterium phage Seabiscuit]YP_009286694.1 head-tail connector protein [Mycobacterium phage Makemake]YP_009637454.1 head-tail connector protein [Mycobacterium phage KSSJEB]AVJ49822.1 hypothetical protein SEA_ICHABOD_17 [Mycobacterium phage Ichabod]AXQ61858.1 hypothetical protein SEA_PHERRISBUELLER_17 [Mycobacterium phage PherrisBueller]QAY03800.1 head-to-tail adaptor [Mycobacterium phage AFIS]QAY13227.1 hypothetical protein SEA_PINKPLASTIC_15 [Mycobacterium 
MTHPYNGAVVRGWLGSLSDSEIVAKLTDLTGFAPAAMDEDYEPAAAPAAVAADDTVQEAIAKLEKRLADLEATVEGMA